MSNPMTGPPPRSGALVRGLALALLAAGSALAAGPPAGGQAQSLRFIIVNPGGRGDQGLASNFLADFASAVEASWPAGDPPPAPVQGNYHVTAADALASIKGRKPLFGQVTAGFYSGNRGTIPMTPLLVPVRKECGAAPVDLVVRMGSTTASHLATGSADGIRLGGQLAAEPEWLARVVLPGAGVAGKPTLVPATTALEAVRDLTSGKVDVVALPHAEWLRLKAAGRDGGLTVVAATQDLPEGPLVAFSRPDDAARMALARRCAEALQRFDQTPQGRAVLDRMGLAGYHPASEADYAAVLALYATGGASAGR